MKIRDWMSGKKAAAGCAPPRDEKPLDSEARGALVQEIFQAVAMVGFLKFRKEEQALGLRVTEDDRKEYFKFLEESYRPEYEAIVAKASDTQVQEALHWWVKEAKSMGLTEWQREQDGNGRAM
jgi:hypothetical protein